MKIVQRASPNHGPRRGVDVPDMVVLHYTGMTHCEAAAQRLCDPATEVSAHYLVDVDGTVFALVPEHCRAWHAGQGAWGAVRDVNSHSIGIEIANPGHHLGYPPFPEPQMAAVETLLADVLDRWAIPPERVIGHACMAPGRKIDPGEKFDWRRLALQGLAVWLDPEEGGPVTSPDAHQFVALARKIGYAVQEPAHALDFGGEVGDVWRAVAMRFFPAKVGRGAPDTNDLRLLGQYAARWPVVDL